MQPRDEEPQLTVGFRPSFATRWISVILGIPLRIQFDRVGKQLLYCPLSVCLRFDGIIMLSEGHAVYV